MWFLYPLRNLSEPSGFYLAKSGKVHHNIEKGLSTKKQEQKEGMKHRSVKGIKGVKG